MHKYTSFFALNKFSLWSRGVAIIFAAWLLCINITVVTAAPGPTPPNTTTNGGGPAQASISDLLCTPETNDLYTCINKMYRFGIAIGFSVAIIMIMIAGYQYMSGSTTGITQAKDKLKTTGIGIGILLISYLLLKQINPDLVTFRTIQPPLPHTQLGTINPPPVLTEGGTGGTSSNGGGAHPEADCHTHTCTDLSKDQAFNCKNASHCQVQPELAQKLDALATAYRPSLFQITQAYPPDPGVSSNPCHQTGACVDIAPTSGTFPELCIAATSVGLNVWNESGTSSAECGPDHTTTTGPHHTTGPHLHVSYP